MNKTCTNRTSNVTCSNELKLDGCWIIGNGCYVSVFACMVVYNIFYLFKQFHLSIFIGEYLDETT